ncbi:hypothetical protein ILUMI_05015 [Ignelater luminosus]|uniref:E3 ubiquitin-protein ligase RBBP6 n=1 Tax=Ignelater luminosus TaxID=2038154 RepID=A0A8K0DCR4_IGNLU|nr:hypothetical protein ILUMI_05015 [Ignelater luminosus]
MSVHYKFKSALEYDTVTFDGLHISVRDLKNAIMQQKRIGKNTDFDLQVTNAQTKEVYDNDDSLIPKNTSLLIARIPSVQSKPKNWEGYGGNSSPIAKVDDGGPIAKAMDLASLDASEDDKIKAMMSQSTQDYDPSNYMKIRGANQMGAVPPNYRCFKCHQGGHWIKDCPLSQGPEPLEIKKSTGIPRSFMVPVEGPQVQGAMMTPNGSFAVPVLDHQAYNEKPQPAPPEEKHTEIPEDLLCSLCSDLLTDAVMIPCCGDSYCDECIRSCLLESEEHECPACHERDISPGTLIPNRYLRNSVSNFKSTTGYVKRLVYKPASTPAKEQPQTCIETEKEPIPANETEKFEKESSPVVKVDTSEKTVIREADSTEPPKSSISTKVDFTEDIDLKDPPKKLSSVISEGPPGVSPRHEQSPKAQPIINVANAPRAGRQHKINERSPRRPHHVQQSPSYQDTVPRNEDRPGTPTVDEPGIGVTTTIGPTTVYPSAPPLYSTGPPPNVMSSMIGLPPPNMQGPPPAIQNSYAPVTGQPLPAVYPPPNQGPPPNFRLPPPGAPPFIQSGYNPTPRPVFDCPRPPITGPPSFPPMYPQGPRPSRGRDYPRDPPRRGRTPPRIIDDPLEAFNRMLREKDERERRAKQRKGRSYSRSSSRSFSRSPRRMRSRSPRRRSRSRSRSFTMSRYRYKEQPLPDRDRAREREIERDRERDKEFRERERDNRGFSRERERERDFRDREPRERERERDREFQFYDNYERDRPRGRPQWNQPIPRKDYPGPPEPYYHAPEMAAQPPPFVPPNRYPPRDVYPPHHLPPVQHPPPLHQHPSAQHLPPMRRYDDVAPPGTEQPPIPGLENPPRFEDRYPYDRNNRDAPPNDRFSPNRQVDKRDDRDRIREEREEFSGIDRERERKHERYSRSPDRNRFTSPRRQSKERERDHQPTPEKPKRRRYDESLDRDKKDSDREKHERKRDLSDDERFKKNKDKKKKKERKEKKEEEKKKRKEKREKREQDKLSKKAAEEKDRITERKSREETKRNDSETQSTNDECERISRRGISEEQSNKDVKYKESVREKERYHFKEKESISSRSKDDKIIEEKVINEDNKELRSTIESNRNVAEIPREAVNNIESSRQDSKQIVDTAVVDRKLAVDVVNEDSKKNVDNLNVLPNSSEKVEESKADLYGDLLTEGIDSSVIQNYGKIKDFQENSLPKIESEPTTMSSKEKESPKDDDLEVDEGEITEDEDSEKDILELHTNEAELKTDLEGKSEVLAPLPERSKWEVDEDVAAAGSAGGQMKNEIKSERSEKSGKVTNEVLKRAENAIFAKAINAIRPIEIKKISLDRAKLYSGEREREKKTDDPRGDVRNIHITIHSYDDEVVAVEPDAQQSSSKPRLSVKERLGCKVDELDRIVKVDKTYDRNRSHSLSPLSRRAGELSRNLGQGERRIEIDDRKRADLRSSHGDKNRDHHYRQYRPERDSRRDHHNRGSRKDIRETKRDLHKDIRRERDRDHHRKDERRRDDRKEKARSRSHGGGDRLQESDEKKMRDKKKRSKSRSNSHDKDKRRRKDKKEKKKEKGKKHHRKEDEDKESSKGKTEDEEKSQKPKSTTDKRKATLDEANFEPDYDLETESEKEEVTKKEKEEKNKKRSVSKSSETEIPKKRVKVEEDSSSSESSDSSSEDDKKKKKHRKHKKKKSRKESSSSSYSDSDSESSDDERDRKRKRHKKKQKKRKKSKHK